MGKKVQHGGAEGGHRGGKAFNPSPNKILTSPAPSSRTPGQEEPSQALPAAYAQLLGPAQIRLSRVRPKMQQLPGAAGGFQEI